MAAGGVSHSPQNIAKIEKLEQAVETAKEAALVNSRVFDLFFDLCGIVPFVYVSLHMLIRVISPDSLKGGNHHPCSGKLGSTGIWLAEAVYKDDSMSKKFLNSDS